MQSFILLPVTAFLINWISMGFIMARRPFNEVARAFLLYCLVLSVWYSVQIFALLPLDYPLPLLVMRLDAVTWLSMGVIFLRFVYRYLGRPTDVWFKIFLGMMVLGETINLFSGLIVESTYIDHTGLHAKTGPLYDLLALLTTAAPASFATILLVRKAAKERITAIRRAEITVIFGTIVSLVSAVGVDLTSVFMDVQLPYSASPSVMVFQAIAILFALSWYNFLSPGVSEASSELFTTSPNATLVVNLDGRVLHYNKSAEKLFEVKTTRLNHIKVNELLPGVDLSRPFTTMDYTLDLGDKQLHLSIQKSEVMHYDVVSGYVVVIMDLTEHDHMMKQVSQSAKLASIGTLSAGVAHEINNPLAIIVGNSSLLDDALKNDLMSQTPYSEIRDEVRSRLGKITGAAQRIMKIVNGLRSYARSNKETSEKVNVHTMIEDTISLVSDIYRKEQIDLQSKFASQKPMVFVNLGRLQQVVMNLVSNARDATEGRPARKIQVETYDEGNRIVIRVKDNGTGIKPENLSKLFTPFFTTKPAGRGTGLGLSLSHNMIQSMGGQMTVKSELGVGTEFHVKLPHYEEDAKNGVDVLDLISEKKETRKAFRASGRALVVEDEADIRDLVVGYLQNFGFEVLQAQDGLVALEILKINQIDLLISDVVMPRMTGDELLKRIESIPHLKNMLILMMTGGVTSQFSDAQRAVVLSHAKKLLEKPFTQGDLENVLKTFLQGAASVESS